MGEGPEPWALQMARECLAFGQFPRLGGWHEQDDLEMACLGVARSAEMVFTKQMKGEKWTVPEAEFAAWIGDD